MIVLGLGSNVGDRLAHLRHALTSIKEINGLTVKQVSPVYLSDALVTQEAAPKWQKPYLNAALSCETSLTPPALLKILKTIERSMGRQNQEQRWAPRTIDIDILVFDDLIIANEMLTIPHKSLTDRPFALWPLADVAPFCKIPSSGREEMAAQMVEKWGSRFTGEAPLHTKQINHRIDTPQLMGIVNITPDSFSDGGHFLNPEKALQQMTHLANAGAEVIDIGAESTAPAATPLEPATEWNRLYPLLAAMPKIKNQFSIAPKISIDTRHVEVAEKALAMGVHCINDVTGLDNQAMRELIAQTKVDCIIMHHLSIPERRHHILPRHLDPTHCVYEWGEKRLQELEKQGITRDQIIFDPGIGFGKMAEQSLLLLKNAAIFKQLGTRLLIGHSRKTFISLFAGLPFAERDIETLTLSLYLANQEVDYLRIHNVDICARGLKVAAAFR